jgi:hypothetical protein
MRRAAYDARNAQTDKESVSNLAVATLVQLPEYQATHTVLWYLDCRSELRTRQALPEALASGKRIIVPYCTADESGANKLGLWWLQSMDELVVGKWKILEPPKCRWGEPGKEQQPEELDAVIVPGGYAPDMMRRHASMVKLVREAAQQGKVVAAICHAGWMLASANIVRGKTARRSGDGVAHLFAQRLGRAGDSGGRLFGGTGDPEAGQVGISVGKAAHHRFASPNARTANVYPVASAQPNTAHRRLT